MADIPSHHLIYGTLEDYITGDILPDTDDERYRQKIAHLLVDQKGYDKSDIECGLKIETLFANQFVVSKIDFVVNVDRRRFMVIRYGPGSLVTRERSAIAAARVLDPGYQIPIAIVTNGQEAEILDTYTGKVVATGLDAIYSKQQAKELMKELRFAPLAPEKRERELRILNAYDKEVCCVGGPCVIPGSPEG